MIPKERAASACAAHRAKKREYPRRRNSAGNARVPSSRPCWSRATGDLERAETLLVLLDGACVASSAVPRELAGIRFLQRRWDEAITLAERAVARDRSDVHAWQLLATSRFLRGDSDGALRAWNARNEPRIDLTRVDGLDRTHHQVVAELVNLPSHSMLTASQLERAKRRVAELPSLQMSRVAYSPRANGLATVDVAVVERPLFPRTRANAIATVVRAAAEREMRLEIASPSGSGELWAAKWRWSSGRPRVSIAAAMPKLWRWTGLWRFDGEWERESYRLPETLMSSERKRAAVTYGDWHSGHVRWELSGALENWNRHGKHFSAGAAVDRRFFQDTLAVRLDSAIWRSMDQARRIRIGSDVDGLAHGHRGGVVIPRRVGRARRQRARAARSVARDRHGPCKHGIAARASADRRRRDSRIPPRQSPGPYDAGISTGCRESPPCSDPMGRLR